MNDKSAVGDATQKTTTLSESTNLATNSLKLWRRIAFWSIFPAIIIAPLWFAGGRGFFGAGGWLIFVTMSGALFIILPYQLVVMTLALFGKKGYLSRWASGLLFAYYALLVTMEISLIDGGDTPESVGSVLTFNGAPEAISSAIYSASILVGLAVMIALVIILIIDIVHNRHTKLVEIPHTRDNFVL